MIIIIVIFILIISTISTLFFFIKNNNKSKNNIVKNGDEIMLYSQSKNCPSIKDPTTGVVNITPSFLKGCDNNSKVAIDFSECGIDEDGSCGKWQIQIVNKKSETQELKNGDIIQLLNKDKSCIDKKYLTACEEDDNITTSEDANECRDKCSKWKIQKIQTLLKDDLIYSGSVVYLNSISKNETCSDFRLGGCVGETKKLVKGISMVKECADNEQGCQIWIIKK